MKKNLNWSIVFGFQDFVAFSIGGIGILMVLFFSSSAYWLIPIFSTLFTSYFLEKRIQLFLILNSVCLYGCSQFLSLDLGSISFLDLISFNSSQLTSSNLAQAICFSYFYVILGISAVFSFILIRNRDNLASTSTLTHLILLFSSLIMAVILGREMIISEVIIIFHAISTLSTIFVVFLLISSSTYLIFSSIFMYFFYIHSLVSHFNLKWPKFFHGKKKSQEDKFEKNKKKVREGL